MKQNISIFVDESEDLGLKDKGKTYYIITLVFHEQENDISNELNKLDKALAELKCPQGAVHTEPLIRREAPYEAFTPNERRAIFTKLFFFAKNCNISYKTCHTLIDYKIFSRFSTSSLWIYAICNGVFILAYAMKEKWT